MVQTLLEMFLERKSLLKTILQLHRADFARNVLLKRTLLATIIVKILCVADLFGLLGAGRGRAFEFAQKICVRGPPPARPTPRKKR